LKNKTIKIIGNDCGLDNGLNFLMAEYYKAVLKLTH
jgi:hypothetical protein